MALFSTNHTLTQGSLHYRLATLGYQKRNPYGVRLPHEKRSLWTVCPFKRNEIKKAQHRWRCAPRNILTQGSSLCSPTLGYQKRNPYGVRLSHELPLRPLSLLKWLSKAEGDGVRLLHKSCKHPLPALPSPWRGGGGEALTLRLYSKLGIFLWFSLLFRIFHQT